MTAKNEARSQFLSIIKLLLLKDSAFLFELLFVGWCRHIGKKEYSLLNHRPTMEHHEQQFFSSFNFNLLKETDSNGKVFHSLRFSPFFHPSTSGSYSINVFFSLKFPIFFLKCSPNIISSSTSVASSSCGKSPFSSHLQSHRWDLIFLPRINLVSLYSFPLFDFVDFCNRKPRRIHTFLKWRRERGSEVI